MNTIADVIARFICLFSKHGRLSKSPDPEFGGESSNMSLLFLSYCSEKNRSNMHFYIISFYIHHKI